jgi:hypothetical protein
MIPSDNCRNSLMEFQHLHLLLLGFTKTADKRWLGERVDLLSIVVLLNIRDNLTAQRAKLAHMVGHLPVASNRAGMPHFTRVGFLERSAWEADGETSHLISFPSASQGNLKAFIPKTYPCKVCPTPTIHGYAIPFRHIE